MFKGRYKISNNIALIGSGCALPRDVILNFRWNENYNLEDVELGIRLSLSNHNIVLTDGILELEVPSSYEAFKIQQYRWSNGAGQLIRGYLGKIWSSTLKLARKIDHTLYILQYASPLAHSIINILGVLILSLGIALQVFNMLIVGLLLVTLLYTMCYIDHCKAEGMVVTRAFRVLGRTGGVLSTMSFDLAYSYLLGLTGKRCVWKVTPKGRFWRSSFKALRGEYMYLIVCLLGVMFALLRFSHYALLWYILQTLPIAYTFMNIAKGRM